MVETVAWAAGNGDRSENGDYIYGKRRLREIDRRIRFLSKRWKAPRWSTRRSRKIGTRYFLARPSPTLTTEAQTTITIVGIDEADFARGQVSWISPIARALMKACEGDIVELRAPAGIEQIEVLAISYGDLDSKTC